MSNFCRLPSFRSAVRGAINRSALFAPSGRFGPPQRLPLFIDALHAAGIGIILDWVPAIFRPIRMDWPVSTAPRSMSTSIRAKASSMIGTLISTISAGARWQGFLIASALYWLEQFHVDGLRVDAVASMLYRDYSRLNGEWVPNVYGGREES